MEVLWVGNFKKGGGCYNFTPVAVIKCSVTKRKEQEARRGQRVILMHNSRFWFIILGRSRWYLKPLVMRRVENKEI